MTSKQALRIWILLIAGWILLTMGVGAATRLTESGLSIVDWRPVTGIFPPLNLQEWQQEFLKYQNYPEFKSNPQMSLQDFKAIFWWEYGHRLIARSLLFVILLPFAYFLWRGVLGKKEAVRVLILLLLGVVQGGIGWFMVSSGLVQVPRVSHLRLMLHFLWACLILAYLADWLRAETSTIRRGHVLRGLAVMCFVQLGLGALVAGSRAGYIFNTFPLMGDRWVPANFFSSGSWVENLLYNQIHLQFFHRLGGWIMAVLGVWAWRRGHRDLGLLIFTQFVLGVLTLVWAIPIPLAVSHQVLGAFLFFRICSVR